ncbi:MAG: Uma2 family endonuclease [Actinobacteria bacterium]|nr:Uma2 family endonuclease [Actinomycetota bacterium]
MTTVTTLPYSRPLTRADLEDTPDDGHRYELIDGALIVSPGPELPHQDMVGNLYLILRAACPVELKVVLAAPARSRQTVRGTFRMSRGRLLARGPARRHRAALGSGLLQSLCHGGEVR